MEDQEHIRPLAVSLDHARQTASGVVPVAEGGALIRTPYQTLRVFVSSTLTELAAEREAARRAIRSLKLVPVLFELGARSHPPRSVYRAYLEQSHIFVGIYWESYGWVAPDMKFSGLEDEYRLAGHLPRLIYVRKPAPDRDPRLKSFLDQIKQGVRVSYQYFSGPRQLQTFVTQDLALLLSERFEMTQGGLKPQPGVPRVDNVPARFNPLIGRDEEVRTLMDLLRRPVRPILRIVPR